MAFRVVTVNFAAGGAPTQKLVPALDGVITAFYSNLSEMIFSSDPTLTIAAAGAPTENSTTEIPWFANSDNFLPGFNFPILGGNEYFVTCNPSSAGLLRLYITDTENSLS